MEEAPPPATFAATSTAAVTKTCSNDLALARASYTNALRFMLGVDAYRCTVKSRDGTLWCGEGSLQQIGTGWGDYTGAWGAAVLQGTIDEGFVYVRQKDGAMRVFHRKGNLDTGSWAHGTGILLGGDFKTNTRAVAVGQDGWIFKLLDNGHLELWGAMNAGSGAGKVDKDNDGWSDAIYTLVPGNPRAIGEGFAQYDAIAAGPGNSLYARKPDGELYFYQWGGSAWHNSGVGWKVGEGWGKYDTFAVSYEDIPAFIPATGNIPAKTTGVDGPANIYNHFVIGFLKPTTHQWGKLDKFLRTQAPDIKKGTWTHSDRDGADRFNDCCTPAKLFCTTYGNGMCDISGGLTTVHCTEDQWMVETTGGGANCLANATDPGLECANRSPDRCTGGADWGCTYSDVRRCGVGCTGIKNDYLSKCGC